jgi:hypothetical protein
MMVYLIGFPDQVKKKIFASLAPSWFNLSFSNRPQQSGVKPEDLLR